MNPNQAPSPRCCHELAYDSESDRVVLFGGWVGDHSNETWSYDLDADAWTNLTRSPHPPGRNGFAMAYDAESDRSVLFGGVSHAGFHDDTWAFDLNANTWTEMSPASHPLRRTGTAMVYDASSDLIVLFGGWTGAANGETWVYDVDANAWTQRSPTESPPARTGHSMVYDESADRVLLFGGGDGSQFFDDTWLYDTDANTWTQVTPPASPAARTGAAMAYDIESQRSVLFGGYSVQAKTWAFDAQAGRWGLMETATSPSPRGDSAMAYDAGSDRIVLFGGAPRDNETWAFNYDAGVFDYSLGTGPPTVHLRSPVDYALFPPGTIIDLDAKGLGTLKVRYELDGGRSLPLAPPYDIDTSAWASGTHVLRVEVEDEAGAGTAERFVFFVDSEATWPPDRVPVDVILIGLDPSPEELADALVPTYAVDTLLRRDPEVRRILDFRFDFRVHQVDSAYHQDLLDYLRTKATFEDSLQARLNITALVDQRDNGTPRDVFDPLVGWEIHTEWVEEFLRRRPPVPSSTAAHYTFYLMNLSALDDPEGGMDHWFVEPTVDPDTLVDQDWWRLEWDNDLNTPMGYPLNSWGGTDYTVYVDPTAYQWYLDWAYVWFQGGTERAPYGLQYEEIAPMDRVDYLAQILNDLVEALAATPPSLNAPPHDSHMLIRNYVLSGSLNHSVEDLQWVSSDLKLQSYLEAFLPFKTWELNTTFAVIEDFPELMEVVDSNTTFEGDRGFIDGRAVFTYLFDNKESFVADESDVFEILSVNFLYDNRSFRVGDREWTGLGGNGLVAIFLKTDRLFYGDGTRQKGLTNVIAHEVGHNLGYGHQFGRRFRADFVDGNMGYFRNSLGYGPFWEDALYRAYTWEKLLSVLRTLGAREPLDLTPEFRAFYGEYRDMEFLSAYRALEVLEEMLADEEPPVAGVSLDGIPTEGARVLLNASDSTDNHRILNYSWDFGDGTRNVTAEPMVEKTWPQPGPYTLTLTVHDVAGNAATATLQVLVRDVTPPALTLLAPADRSGYDTAKVEVVWEASDVGVGIDRIELVLDEAPPVRVDPTVSSYTFEGVSEGTHRLLVTAFDRHGNQASVDTVFSVAMATPSFMGLHGSVVAVLFGGLGALAGGVAAWFFSRWWVRREEPPPG